MGLFSKDIKTFDELFSHGLRDMYYAEQQIVEALPKMIDNAVNRDLRNGLQKHLVETRGQIKRLEQVFSMRGEEPEGTRCVAIVGLLDEGNAVMGNIDNESVMDAAIIAAAQAVEHYEITRYGALIAWAQEMGRAEVGRVLKATLDEEKATDKKLTMLAEGRVNPRAQGKAPGDRRKTAGKKARAPATARAGTRRSTAGVRKPARRAGKTTRKKPARRAR
jgi:ferritin-like metal-binding protein YciE